MTLSNSLYTLITTIHNTEHNTAFDIYFDQGFDRFEVRINGVKVFYAQSEALARYGIRAYYSVDLCGLFLTEFGPVLPN